MPIAGGDGEAATRPAAGRDGRRTGDTAVVLTLLDPYRR